MFVFFILLHKSEKPQHSSYLVLPSAHWGKDYFLASPGPLDNNCVTVTLFSLVATKVRFQLQGEGTAEDPNREGVVVLEDATEITTDGVYNLHLETKVKYRITSFHWDMTGSRLTSTEPISVVYGPK